MSQTALPPVRKSVVVPIDCAAAFDLFTRRLGEWWPLAHRSATLDAVSCDVEPHAGGRLFERTRDGGESTWGRFRVFDEPRRLVFSWHPGAPETAATEVEITFTPLAKQTRVDLEHRDWERLGERASFVRGLFDGGWVAILDRLVALASGAPDLPWTDSPGCIVRT